MSEPQNQNSKNEPREEKLLDHNYDGIQELDNPLPGWWVYLFYVTIVFSAGYMICFSFFVKPSGARAEAEVQQLLHPEEKKETAAEASAVSQKTDQAVPAASLDEPVFDHDDATLETGKKVFQTKCLACHGAHGEGLVGPNMTDNYWLHGKGTEKDIYQTVVDGVPEKGMISWKPLLSDEEIRAVVVYMKSLQGTKPENPKAPQGELVG